MTKLAEHVRKVSGSETMLQRGDYFLVAQLAAVDHTGQQGLLVGRKAVMNCPICNCAIATSTHTVREFSFWTFVASFGKRGRGLTITPELGCPTCRNLLRITEGQVALVPQSHQA